MLSLPFLLCYTASIQCVTNLISKGVPLCSCPGLSSFPSLYRASCLIECKSALPYPPVQRGRPRLGPWHFNKAILYSICSIS